MDHKSWWASEGCSKKWRDRESLSRQGWIAALKHGPIKNNGIRMELIEESKALLEHPSKDCRFFARVVLDYLKWLNNE